MSRTESRRRFRPGLWATVATAALVAVMLGLGTWQVQRLQWKTALIAEREARLNADPVPLPADLDDPDAYNFRPVTVTGRFLHAQELYLAGRNKGRRPGYGIVTPLERPDGRVVLIDRGWVPLDLKDPATRAAGQVEGTVTITGIARLPQSAGWLMPDHEASENFWFTIDLEAMGAFIGRDPAPVYVQAFAPANPGGYPVGERARVDLPNDHLQYAITWYSLAVILLVIYYLYHRRKKH